MKNRLSTIVGSAGVAVSLLSNPSQAQDNKIDVEFGLKYQYWDLGKTYEYKHETHPDDKIFMNGNPGTTSVSEAHVIGLSLEFSKQYGRFEPNAELGLLIPIARDEKQNDNDSRPEEIGSFIYSKVFPTAGQLNLGVRYYPFEKSRFYIGPSVRGTVFSVDHGWDRWGADESAESEIETSINAGPTVGYRGEDVNVYTGYFRGVNNQSSQIEVGINIDFW